MSKTRRSGQAKKTRLRKHRLALTLVLVVLAISVGSFITYGMLNAANVDFTFGGPNDLYHSYRLMAMSRFSPATIDITHIFVRNIGGSDVSIVVTLHAMNAVVSTGYYGPYSDSANIQLSLPPASGYRFATFYLTLPLQVTSFTLSITIGQVLDFSSIARLATSTMTSLQPQTPTTLVYMQERANSTNYALVQQY